ncbi:hypothetical protein [Streptomyces sp. NPDC006784]|uniref:hypothetical protein n=1 Tax=Streptomyces sp. NPDC006784 TaxID=3364764 RepID=UPI00367E3D25
MGTVNGGAMVNGPRSHTRTDRAVRADRASIIFDLRIQGLTYKQIDVLTQAPDGPTGGHRISSTVAKELVYEESARRVDPRVDAWRALEAERLEASLRRLDDLAAKAYAIVEREHASVSQGKVLEVIDETPVLQALDKLIKIEEQRRKISESLRKLFGADAPQQFEASITETTQQDLELRQMIDEAKAKVAAEEAGIVDRGPDEG